MHVVLTRSGVLRRVFLAILLVSSIQNRLKTPRLALVQDHGVLVQVGTRCRHGKMIRAQQCFAFVVDIVLSALLCRMHEGDKAVDWLKVQQIPNHPQTISALSTSLAVGSLPPAASIVGSLALAASIVGSLALAASIVGSLSPAGFCLRSQATLANLA